MTSKVSNNGQRAFTQDGNILEQLPLRSDPLVFLLFKYLPCLVLLKITAKQCHCHFLRR